MSSAFHRKQNRLPLEDYRGARAYSLTLTCAERRPVFLNGRWVERGLRVLRSTSAANGFAVLAYCFMPNHVHVLVEGSEASDLPLFVKDFKQRTGFEYRQARGQSLWQKSYYDHVLRREEAVWDVVRYIVGNPVRAGLVTTAGDHPYSGSFVWGREIMEA